MIIECDECNITIDAKILHSYEIVHNDDPLINIKYNFCQCGKCLNPIFSKTRNRPFG